MKSFSISLSDSSLRLHRFLRKSAIDSAVVIIRFGVVALVVLLLILVINSAVRSFFRTSSQISELDQTVVASLTPQPFAKVAQTTDRNYKVIASSKLLGELGTQVAPKPTAPAKAPSQINLQLIGTFISAGQAPYAIIEDKKKKAQDVFMINDSIFGEAKLTSITSDRVEVEFEGRTEILKLDDTPDASVAIKDGVGAVSENEYVVEEAELDKALENLPLLLTQARAVPYFKDGKSIGLRMFAIRSASIFEKIGLRNGDVLKSINGSSLGDLSQAMKLFERLKEERSLSLILERNNQEKEFKYQIK